MPVSKKAEDMMEERRFVTNSLMTGAPTVLTRWMESCKKNTTRRREGIALLPLWSARIDNDVAMRTILVNTEITTTIDTQP